MRFTLCGAKIVITFEAVAALCAALILDRENRIAACFFAALCHEGGHLLMMALFSCRVKSLKLGLFDVKIDAEESQSALFDTLITLGGPLMNFLLALCFFPFFKKLTSANLALGFFNLLPIESLDGGRLFTLFFSRFFMTETVRKTLKATTFLCLLPLFFCGIYVLFRSRYNYSLLIVSLYLLAVLLIK